MILEQQVQPWAGGRPRERGSYPWLAGIFALLVLGGAIYRVFPNVTQAFLNKQGSAGPSATQVYGAAPEPTLQKEGSAAPGMLASEGSAARVILDKDGNAVPATLSKEGAAPAASLAVEGSSPVVMQRPADAASMPDDVRAWLEHLRKIEERKKQLSIRQMADLSVFMQSLMTLEADIGKADGDSGSNSKSADQVTQGKFEDLRPDWRTLIADFRSVQAPDECKPIADSYFSSLNEIPGMTGDLIDALTNAQTNPQAALQKVMAMRSTSGGTIDRGFKSADDQISAICQKYGVSKWFAIKDDVMSGSVLGLPGMGGNPLGN